MLLVNLSDDLVNGKIGTIIEIDNQNIIVKFPVGETNKTVKLEKYLFTKFDPVDKICLAKRLQFPIKLAFAITIHKSQGMTLEHVVVDCNNAHFPGQIGVADGRAKTTDGLVIKNFKPSLVKPHPDVVYKLYENNFVSEINKDVVKCCKTKITNPDLDENNNSESTNSNIKSSDSLSDEDTVNYFEQKHTGSEFSDMEPDILNIIDEMEMPEHLAQAFDKVITDLHDTPLYDTAVKVKTGSLEILLVFSQWYDVQRNKFHEISLNAFPAVKTQFSAKGFNKFYLEINQYMQSNEFREMTSKLAENFKSIDKNSTFQVLANISFNLQFIELEEVNNRSEKALPSVLEKISLEQDLATSGRGKIRYVAGYVVAKLKYRNSKVLRNSLFAPGKEKIINRAKTINEILDSFCITYADLVETTSDPESLLETQRKQNRAEALCNITDNCFHFFQKLEEHCRELLTYENLFDNRSDMYTVVESKILHSSAHEKLFLQNLVGKFYCEEHGISDAELDKSHLCETDDCYICELIRTIFQSIICLFVKVSMAQFRRDYLSALKVYKSKALRKKVMEKSKAKTKQLDLQFLREDKSENKEAFHLRLKSELMQGSTALDKFKKPDLMTLCAAYSIQIAKSKKKFEIVEILSRAVQDCNVIPNPEILHNFITKPADN